MLLLLDFSLFLEDDGALFTPDWLSSLDFGVDLLVREDDLEGVEVFEGVP